MDVVTLGMAKAAANKKFQPLRQPTIILFGDSRTADCNYADATNDYSTNMSWFDWGQALLTEGPVFNVIRNAGIGGNTTTQMKARFQTDVLDYKPSHMTLWAGTNDLWATVSDVDASYDRMTAMMDTARAQGIYVFLISETVASAKGATFNAMVQYYNERLRRYTLKNTGVEFWDFNAKFVNPLSTTGTPLTVMTRDGIHLSAQGAFVLGRDVVAKKLARFSTPLTNLAATLIDTWGNNTIVRNVASNPLMQVTTGGTLGTGDTGTLPDGWVSTGSPAAAYSTPARADGFGNDLKAVITASAAAGKFLNNAIAPARLIAGKKYVIEAAVSIDAATNLFALSIITQVFNGGAVYSYGHGLNTQSPVVDTLGTGNMIWRSREFTAPAFTPTSVSLSLTARFGAAGSATVRVGRITLKAVE